MYPNPLNVGKHLYNSLEALGIYLINNKIKNATIVECGKINVNNEIQNVFSVIFQNILEQFKHHIISVSLHLYVTVFVYVEQSCMKLIIIIIMIGYYSYEIYYNSKRFIFHYAIEPKINSYLTLFHLKLLYFSTYILLKVSAIGSFKVKYMSICIKIYIL